MKSKLERRGQDLVVVIPEEIATAAHISEETDVDLSSRGDEVVISRHRLTIEELVEGITEENRHEETDWGPPVGNEVW